MRFIKDIVSVGKYHIPDGNGGAKEHEISLERLRKWANTFNAMRDNGIRVPCPFNHDVNAVPVQLGPDGMLPSSQTNAGFWDALWVDEDQGRLMGVLDAPGDAGDASSPAGKISKTVRETSVYVRPKGWKDGSGKEWEEPILHIAAVTHPIQPGQDNFQPLVEDIAIAMSFKQPEGKSKLPKGKAALPVSGETDDVDPTTPSNPDKVLGSESPDVTSMGGSVGDIIQLLRDVAKIGLPEDTNEHNFLERLRIALTQKSISEEEDDESSVYQPPEGAALRNAPFVMAFSQQQIDAIVTAKVNNPVTGKPFSAGDLQSAATVDAEVVMSHPKFVELTKSTNSLLNTINEQAKSAYKSRIDALVKTGRAGKAYADSNLIPMVDVLTMSFGNDGKPVAQPLDIVLSTLEALQPIAQPAYDPVIAMSHSAFPAGATTHDTLPFPRHGDDETPLSADAMAAVFGRLQAAGVLTK
jgi:hypothetical protein